MVNKMYVYHVKYGKGILVDKKEDYYIIDFSGIRRNFSTGLWGIKLFLNLSDMQKSTKKGNDVFERSFDYEYLNNQDAFEKEILANQKRNYEIALNATRYKNEIILLSNIEDIVVYNCRMKRIEVIAPFTKRVEEVFRCDNYIIEFKKLPLLTLCTAELAYVEDEEIFGGNAIVTSKIKKLDQISFEDFKRRIINDTVSLHFDNHIITPFSKILYDTKIMKNSYKKYYLTNFSGSKIRIYHSPKTGKDKYQLKMDDYFIDIVDRNINTSMHVNKFYRGLALIQAYPIKNGNKTGYKAMNIYENRFLSEDRIEEIKSRYIQDKIKRYRDNIIDDLRGYEFIRCEILKRKHEEQMLSEVESYITTLEELKNILLEEPEIAFKKYRNIKKQTISKNLEDFMLKVSEEEKHKVFKAEYEDYLNNEFYEDEYDENPSYYSETECDESYYRHWEEEYGYEGYKDGGQWSIDNDLGIC